LVNLGEKEDCFSVIALREYWILVGIYNRIGDKRAKNRSRLISYTLQSLSLGYRATHKPSLEVMPTDNWRM
jgi:hypothetical protein